MNTLRQISFIVLFIFILIFELLIGIIGEFPELRILPFLILLFYISSEKFSNSFVLAFFFSGIYYDLFYTSNYFGSTSAKFILLGILVNFIYTKINQNIYSEFLAFFVATIIYKIETIVYSFTIYQLTIIFLISVINYFLFKLINITLKRDVFKKSI